MMRELPWRLLAWIVSQPRIAAWLIARSKRTPYYPITSRDGSDLYMDRHWIFNPYGKSDEGKTLPPRWQWLPSIRVHHILRADDDGALHDHPWNARTILLRGWYEEERPCDIFSPGHRIRLVSRDGEGRWTEPMRELHRRAVGDTTRVLFNSYHRISEVSPGGVYTLWFTWKYQGTWGFLKDGVKIPYYEYLKEPHEHH